jgi:hypothetical protein
MIFSALPVITVMAQEEGGLPDPGTTPDSWLYGFDRAIEAIQKAFTFSPEGKARLALELASERLAEAKAMERIGKPDLANNTVQDYATELEDAGRLSEEIPGTEVKAEIKERILNTVDMHLATLNNTLPIDPTYKAKRTAEDKGVEIASTIDEKAKRQLTAARNRVIEAKALVEKGGTQFLDELSTKHSEQLDKAAAYGEQISDLAQKKEFEKLLAEAASIHIKVLENVLEKVLEQAKPAIEKALNSSIAGLNRALDRLGEIDPANASALYLKYAEERLGEAMVRAERGDMERFSELINEYRNMLDRSLTLVEEGQKAGVDTSGVAKSIRERVAEHLEDLQKMRGMVPEDGREDVDEVIGNATKAQEFASQFSEKKSPTLKPEMGRLTVKVTDAPIDDFTSVNATFTSVKVLKSGKPISTGDVTGQNESAATIDVETSEAEDGEGENWFVVMNETVTVDLLKLRSENTSETLGVSNLEAGKYTHVQVVVTNLTGALTGDGGSIPIEVQEGVFKITKPFTILPSNETTITIDFTLDKGLIKTGTGEYKTIPPKMIGPVKVEYSSTVSPSIYIMEPEDIRETVISYIKTNHSDAAPYIPSNISWSGGRETPGGLVGHETYVYTGSGWNVTIEWNVVAPENLTYEITVEYEDITWTGTIHKGTITETSYQNTS